MNSSVGSVAGHLSHFKKGNTVAIQQLWDRHRQLDLQNKHKLPHIALLKVEGFSKEEIAERLGCVLRAVERRLHAIRGIWVKEKPT